MCTDSSNFLKTFRSFLAGFHGRLFEQNLKISSCSRSIFVLFQFTTRGGVGWVAGFAPLSGVILCIILVVMVIFSMQWIRRGGHFQVTILTSSTPDNNDDRHVSLGLLLDSSPLSSISCAPHHSCRTVLGKIVSEDVRRENVHL